MKEFASIQDMSQMPIMERLSNGLIVTVLGMGMTILVLVLLYFAIKLMSNILSKEESPKATQSEPIPLAPLKEEKDKEDEELIAVFMAAIMAHTGQDHKKIKFQGYREVGTDLPLWSKAGVMETMNREI
ncbi:MAG TPA: OadG family protein [Clostridia bacterium]|nr:OadG family protein [Clostridia bacterium]